VGHSPGCLFSVYAFAHNLRLVYLQLGFDAGELLADFARSSCGVASPTAGEAVSTISKIYRLASQQGENNILCESGESYS
jgi:hypothetical protein